MKTAVSAVVLLVCSAFAIAAPPEIKVPTNVTGEAGDFIPIVVETEGKQVKFYPITKGLKVFPSGFVANPKATVVSARDEGTYTLLCYTGKGDELTDPVIITIKIGAGGGGDDGGGDMGTANPILKDPLYKVVAAAWKNCTADEKTKKVTLSAVYKALGDSLADIKTVADLTKLISETSTNRLGTNLKPIRSLFGGEFETFIPSKVNQVLTDAEKAEAAKQLKRYSAILDALK